MMTWLRQMASSVGAGAVLLHKYTGAVVGTTYHHYN
jgi:hypothetical protein